MEPLNSAYGASMGKADGMMSSIGAQPVSTLGGRLQELRERLNGISATALELADRIGGPSMVGNQLGGEKSASAPEPNDLVAIATRLNEVADRIERSLSRAYNSL